MKSENTGIMYMKHKQHGMLYRPRDFTFIRFAYTENNSYYIMDKSIDY